MVAFGAVQGSKHRCMGELEKEEPRGPNSGQSKERIHLRASVRLCSGSALKLKSKRRNVGGLGVSTSID